MNLNNLLKSIIVITTGIILNMEINNKRIAHVFDLDDTLIKTEAKVYLFTPDNVIYKAFTSEEVKYKKDYLKQKLEKGYILNFDEVGDCPIKTHYFLMKGMEIEKNVDKFKRIDNKFNHDLFILTGRGNAPDIIHDVIYRRFKVDMDIENIIPVAHKPTYENIEKELIEYYEEHPVLEDVKGKDMNPSASQIKKKICLLWILSRGYDEIHFYDDDEDNIIEANILKKIIIKYDEFKHIKMFNYLM